MRVFILLISIFLSNYSYSQQTISGVVSDETGETIPGATILELNTNNGSVTDINGNYSITISSSDAIL